MKTNFPTDSDGKLCSYDYPAYKYVYFADLSDTSRRVCVASCPSSSDKKLKCRATDAVGCNPNLKAGSVVQIYDTNAVDQNSGSYCFPVDETLSEQVQKDADIWDKNQFIKAWQTIIFGAFIALACGAVYFLLTQFIPKIMNYAAIILGSLAMISLGIVIFAYPSEQFSELKGLTAIFGILLIIFAIILLAGLFLHRKQVRINGVFLLYASKMVKANWAILVYIPVFLLFVTGLIVLTVFEFLAVWSVVDPSFDKTKIYWQAKGAGPNFLTVLIFIQLYWGLSFLKEAFNFCVAGNAVNWYFKKNGMLDCVNPFCRILKYHFGSVVGGSFMTGFFTIFDFIVDLFRPDGDRGCCARFCIGCCGWLNNLFELVRSDAMAYINMSALPYCNASRYCEFLCNNTKLFTGSQSVSRVYRFSAHLLLMTAIGYLGLYYKGDMALYAQIFLMVLALFVVTFFISIHADASEGLLITFLADEYLQIGDWQEVKNAPDGLVAELKVAAL